MSTANWLLLRRRDANSSSGGLVGTWSTVTECIGIVIDERGESSKRLLVPFARFLDFSDAVPASDSGEKPMVCYPAMGDGFDVSGNSGK